MPPSSERCHLIRPKATPAQKSLLIFSALTSVGTFVSLICFIMLGVIPEQMQIAASNGDYYRSCYGNLTISYGLKFTYCADVPECIEPREQKFQEMSSEDHERFTFANGTWTCRSETADSLAVIDYPMDVAGITTKHVMVTIIFSLMLLVLIVMTFHIWCDMPRW